MSAKVFLVEHEYQADYKVFFVEHPYQQQNHQLIVGGQLVNQASQANVKVFLVDHEYQATIKIQREHFPK